MTKIKLKEFYDEYKNIFFSWGGLCFVIQIIKINSNNGFFMGIISAMFTGISVGVFAVFMYFIFRSSKRLIKR